MVPVYKKTVESQSGATRREFIHLLLAGAALAPIFLGMGDLAFAKEAIGKLVLTDKEWNEKLTAEQYDVLRHEGTERPFTSALNHEKRQGIFVCAGCDLPLFTSRFKYDSGTGWPSFFDALPDHVETKTDYKLAVPRTEYHCARCGGHQGHVFKDGPEPTGLRYCNNGVALKFVPDKA